MFPLEILDAICSFYHQYSSFPLVLSEQSSENERLTLTKIGTLLDKDVPTDHLLGHILVLIIADGAHGKDLVDYLYRENVFHSGANTGIDSAEDYKYYVYPRRDVASVSASTLAHCIPWPTKCLRKNTGENIFGSVPTLDVVTDEIYMKTTSTFFLHLCNTSKSGLTSINTLIDTIVQDQANLVFVVLHSSSLKSGNMFRYHQAILSIVESGQMKKLHLFVHFDEPNLTSEFVKTTLEEFNSSLLDVFKGRRSVEISKCLSFSAISVPKGVRLVEHLLGVHDKRLENFFQCLNGNVVFDNIGGICEDEENNGAIDNYGMEKVLEPLQEINKNKINISLRRLEDDLDNLLTVSRRLVHEDRAKELNNIIVRARKYLGCFQNFMLLALIPITLFLHIISALRMSDILIWISPKMENPVSSSIMNLLGRYTKNQWIAFYTFVLAYYITIRFFGGRLTSIETLDKDKSDKHRVALKHLEDAKIELNHLKNKAFDVVNRTKIKS